jgi:hypothetical protein
MQCIKLLVGDKKKKCPNRRLFLDASQHLNFYITK